MGADGVCPAAEGYVVDINGDAIYDYVVVYAYKLVMLGSGGNICAAVGGACEKRAAMGNI